MNVEGTWGIVIDRPPGRPSWFLGPRTLPVGRLVDAMTFSSKEAAEQEIDGLKHSGFAQVLRAVDVATLSGRSDV